MQKFPYLSAVGSLMYLATCTRPDIYFTVSTLARFCANPGEAHWQAVKHLFHYFKSSVDLQLTYKAAESNDLFVTYSDSVYSGDKDTLHSTGVYVAMMNGEAVD